MTKELHRGDILPEIKRRNCKKKSGFGIDGESTCHRICSLHHYWRGSPICGNYEVKSPFKCASSLFHGDF